MGIAGFFYVLGALALIAILLIMGLVLSGRRRLALRVTLTALACLALWYLLPLNDRVAAVLFFPQDTIYATGYLERSFQNLRLGQSQEEVLAILGEPLEMHSNSSGEKFWRYSGRGSKYPNYWIRIVVFGPSGRVVKKFSELYSD